MPAAFNKNKIEITTNTGEKAVYEFAGQCEICGKRVFVCISHPVRCDGEIGERVAAFQPASKGQVYAYCQSCFNGQVYQAPVDNRAPHEQFKVIASFDGVDLRKLM